MVLVENYAGHHQNWLKCFDDPEMSDVVFEAKDGQTFHCERLVLEIASPYFKKLFSCPQKLVAAKDVDPTALKWILRACYTGDGNLDDDNVVSVMFAARMYEMDWVEKACMKYLKEDMGGPLATFEYSKENEKWLEWTVPRSGWYHVVAMGAKGANLLKPTPHIAKLGAVGYIPKSGMGAILGASFELQANDVLQILTGGMSRIYISIQYPNTWGGAGGGTFVALKEKELTLLLAAGGGGSNGAVMYGSDANLGEDGIGSSAKVPGGKNGGNGASAGIHTGGLGWKAGPVALAKPRSADINYNGGFGGGGNACGGGGGYSGGAAASSVSGGGGGSYIASQAANSWKKVGNEGPGKVFIWRGKKVPMEETFFLRQVGTTGEEGQINGEPLDSWEMLD